MNMMENGISRISAASLFSFDTETKEPFETEFSEKTTLKPSKPPNTPLFRTARRRLRKLNKKVLRWDHKEKLREDEADGCGFPVCTVLEARVRR